MKSTPIKWKIAQKLEYKWWQKYLEKKDPEEYLQRKLSYWNKLLGEIAQELPSLNGKRILDAGCGPAGIFLALNHNKVDAIDPLLDKYQNLPHFDEKRVEWVNFKCQTLESFNQIEVYDVIFCLNAINHVRNVESCYDNLIKALKPGGIMVISTDAHKHQFLKKVFQFLPGDVLHPVQLDIEEYNEFLTNRDLKILKSLNYEKGKIFDYYVTIAKK